MSLPLETPSTSDLAVLRNIVERQECGLTILSSRGVKATRRLLYVNSYGGVDVWSKIKTGLMPPHHLWGCIELMRFGYEVALADPLGYFSLRKRPFPHDLALHRFIRSWMRKDDIIFAGHTVLYWLPLLRRLSFLKSHVVSLTFGREELDFCRAHSGIIGMTPAAADQARRFAPNAKVAHLGWGVDLDFFPILPYRPDSLLSCGITNRDHRTLSEAARMTNGNIRVIVPGMPRNISWPQNVEVVDSGAGWNYQRKKVTFRELLHDHYARSAGTLVIINPDPKEYTANGFTNALESMAMARPVVVSRTGALPSELDVEKLGCGLFVPPDNPQAVAQAIDIILKDPRGAQQMGNAGRALCEKHYNIKRFADDLATFFDTL